MQNHTETPANVEDVGQPKREASLAAPTLLDGWVLERRSYGVGTCGGATRTVLSRGKWSVIGATGEYRIIFPSGWREDTPVFQTELEAMLWVMSKTKPSNDPSSATRPTGRYDCNRDAMAGFAAAHG